MRSGQPTLGDLRDDARDCRRCPLWKRATQTVFGRGAARAKIMLVGEQPGDKEDLEGKPFVGPAGQVLKRALAEAGIEDREVYVTNAVKHFKWTERGKRRIHEKPNREEILACRMWLDGEIAAIRPALVVALGVSAASALLGTTVRIGAMRGRVLDSRVGVPATVTAHPSSVLRAPDAAARATGMKQLVQDLKHAAAVARGTKK